MRSGRQEGREEPDGTWARGGTEWMTAFGVKGRASIHLLPAIKRVT